MPLPQIQDFPKKTAKKAVDSFFDITTDNIRSGNKIFVGGLGYFSKESRRTTYQSAKKQSHKALPLFRRKYIDKATPLIARAVTRSQTNNMISNMQKGFRKVFAGGDDYVLRKRPGRVKYSNITLKRGYALGESLGHQFRLTHEKQELLHGLIKSMINSYLDLIEGVAVSSPVDVLKSAPEIKRVFISIRGIGPEKANRVYRSIYKSINRALAVGERVMIPEFGTFSVEPKVQRTGRNPQTGKEIKIAAKSVVKFKAGADLSGRVN